MTSQTLIAQIEVYFEQRQRCFDNCWATQLQLRQLDQQAANLFYLLTKQRKSLKTQQNDNPFWLSLLLSETVAETIQLLASQSKTTHSELICIQWWAQQNNGAALIAALISLETTSPELTKQLLCVIASATPIINDQFNFLHVNDIKPCINFINQHLGRASQIWFSHFLNHENTDDDNKKLLELTLCRGNSAAKLPALNSTLLADKCLLKQYVIQADSKLVNTLINELSKHNDNAKFVLSMMAFSGYKQFVPWLIQMLTAGFLSHAAFAALHTLLGTEFERQLPDGLYGEFEPESQVELLVALKQTLTAWWEVHRDDFPEQVLAGKAINESNITSVWQQGNIFQCEVAAYRYWCLKVEHRLTDARGFNTRGLL
ncbi:MAG: hypothetical protein HRT95_17635 [Moritella sp.]|uniref:hypothetical protein n=1 Tax=Moritella sp. TaxID=78556 RepID=UPI001DD30AB2|nr:hypothetical protein [Moritella sp.]NQZ51923.1 hypothetical protein [Moritella sp.]